MVPIHLTADDLGNFITRTNTPLAVLGQYIDHPDIDVVHVQDESATYDATRWLITERGHRQFGFVGVSDDLPPGPRRLRGFTNCLAFCVQFYGVTTWHYSSRQRK